jgi:iron complex outermembrane receptor protein
MTNHFAKWMLAASPAALLLAQALPAMAQSTATQEIETDTVTAERTLGNGIMRPIVVPKERATITQDFINTQIAGQTVFESLNTVPGFNFTNNDGYGNSGGDVRLHGFEGNRISFTWDGMPLNDTGNYAIFTNQVADSEIIGSTTVSQGSTDSDSPTAAATGGVIAILTDKPKDDMGMLGDVSFGSFNQQRYFLRGDSGEFGPWGTKAFMSLSYDHYDKWKGAGYLQKRQFNASIYQDMGALGWFTLSAHYNQNRNNFYNTVSYEPTQASNFGPTGIANTGSGIGVNAPNVALGPDGNYVGVGSSDPSVFAQAGQGYGLNFDYFTSCAPTPGVNGTAQAVASCGSNFYKVRINPSNTGNIRASSLWHLTEGLDLTFDPSIQYVLANGGGTTTLSESENRLKGSAATAGKDLNGDGDTLDSVLVYSPSNTNTIRYGLNTSLVWTMDDQNVFQLGYTLDYGLHRQTGQMAYLDSNGAPFDVFAGYRDIGHRVLSADGTPIRSRDRRSRAILNQVAFTYDGKFLDDTLAVTVAVRAPFLERDLNQLCYVMVAGTGGPGIGFPYCSSAAPIAPVGANGTVSLAGTSVASALFAPPSMKVVKYNRVLPNIGVSWSPWGKEQMFYAAFASSLSAPRTDNLYNGGNNGQCTNSSGIIVPTQAGCVFSSFSTVQPETSQTYSLGYRYNTDMVQASIDLYNSQFKNRIVTSFDQDQGISVDRNIGSVNLDGVDAAVNVFPIDGLSIYSSVAYEHTRVAASPFSTIKLSATGASISLTGKQIVETPEWTASQRYQYKIAGFTFGVGGKLTGREYATDNNDFRIPSYIVFNADIGYDLGELGWDGASIRLNGTNLFNERYLTYRTGRTCFTWVSPTTSGCTSAPFFNVGSPAVYEVTLRASL